MPTRPETVNIPAYLRKRSIAAKSRRRTTIPTPPKKLTVKRKVFIEPIVQEIPLVGELDKTELFPAPIESEPDNRSTREMKICGMCEGYFDKIEVAIIKLTSPLRRGNRIIFEKQDGLFEQKVDSMQINRKDVKLAKTGSDIGLKVAMQPKVGAPVYKVI